MTGASSDEHSGHASPRFKLRASVVRYCGEPMAWSTVDLSDAGAFVESTKVLREGTELDLALSLPDAGGVVSLSARGRVMWTNDLFRPRKPGFPSGMGLEFVSMTEADRAFLRAYLCANAPTVQEPLPCTASEPASQRARQPGRRPRPRPAAADSPREAEATYHSGGAARSNRPLPRYDSRIGAYRILEVLGTGGVGDVILAEHVRLRRKVALKKLGSELAHDEKIVRRFLDEARVVNRIRHPNIVEVIDFIRQGNDYYYVTELIEGCNLSELDEREGPLPLHRLLNIGMQLCGALEVVHRAGVVHRDLQPANVMVVRRRGSHDFVKLIDFGVAKLRDPVDGWSLSSTTRGIVLGSPEYMAPEQILERHVDARADIYSVGALLFRMSLGRTPSRAHSWGELLRYHARGSTPALTAEESRRIPPDLRELMLHCLDKDPGRRPQSAAAVAHGLRRTYATAWSAAMVREPRHVSVVRKCFWRGLGWAVLALLIAAAAFLFA